MSLATFSFRNLQAGDVGKVEGRKGDKAPDRGMRV